VSAVGYLTEHETGVTATCTPTPFEYGTPVKVHVDLETLAAVELNINFDCCTTIEMAANWYGTLYDSSTRAPLSFTMADDPPAQSPEPSTAVLVIAGGALLMPALRHRRLRPARRI
jgi:hypothetical protein